MQKCSDLRIPPSLRESGAQVTRRERIRSWFRQLAWGFDPAARAVIRGPAEIVRQVRETQRAYDRLAGVMSEASRQVVGFDPGDPGGDRTAIVIARVCAGQVHATDSGLLNRNDHRNAYECARCGHAWHMAELVSARHLEAVGIVPRLILVTEPDADESIVLAERAHAQPGQLFWGATLAWIADRIERMDVSTEWSVRTPGATPVTFSGALTGPREAFDALAAAAIGTREEPAQSSSALAPAPDWLPPNRPT